MNNLLALWLYVAMLVVIFARDPTALRLTLLLSIFVTAFTARLVCRSYQLPLIHH